MNRERLKPWAAEMESGIESLRAFGLDNREANLLARQVREVMNNHGVILARCWWLFEDSTRYYEVRGFRRNELYGFRDFVRACIAHPTRLLRGHMIGDVAMGRIVKVMRIAAREWNNEVDNE